ncbi:glycosyltransferase [Lapidilactobacillus wuchangensis]|uniref:glycosyltransferase n=1 Tax=Lapidilactobacillus wuchangensis TaxID=2486001 RepID=UPI000F7A7665|nr:glycosyltransferase [Lapidilactobacillus wuchangensis]
MPELSVLISVYNRNQLLTETLISLCQQTLPRTEFEVIIGDDGSSSDTLAVVRQFENQLELKYLYQTDLGFRAGTVRNLSAQVARGKYLVILDAGIVLSEDALQQHLTRQQMSTKPTTFLGNIYGFDRLNENRPVLDSLQISGHNVNQAIQKLQTLAICDARRPIFERYGTDLTTWRAPWLIFWVGHSSLPRQEFLDLGGFDESFNGWGYEDIDLGIRWFKADYDIQFAGEIGSVHLPHEKFKEQLAVNERVQYSCQRKQKLLDKHQLAEIQDWLTLETIEIDQHRTDKN